MKKTLLIAGLIIVVLAAAGVYYWSTKRSVEKPVAKRDTLIIGVKGDILGWHPKMTDYETPTVSANFNIFDGLVEFDKDFKIVPALAVSWSNPDNLTWRFYLRHGVKFQNGEDFTAADAKYTMDYIMNDPTSVLKDLLADIDTVQIVDDYTIDIKTKQPTPILLNKLTDIFIIPKDYQNIPASQWPIGTGAYKLKEYVKGDHITFERFDDYWKGPAPIKTVTLKIIPDDAERTTALVNGQIDLAEQITTQGYKELQGNKKVLPVATPSTRIIFLSFDFRKTNSLGFKGTVNPTADVRVRKAMYEAIDENYIITNIMDNMAVPASQFVSSNIFGYNPKITRLPYNLDDAKALMKEAGYENGFTIQLDCPNNRYINDEAICKDVARQLKSININVKLNAQSKDLFFPLIDNHKSSFYLLGWDAGTIDGGEIFYYMLHTVSKDGTYGGYNVGYYSNPEVDKLGDESAQIMDPLRRLQVLQQGFQVAMDDVVWIPLHAQELLDGVAADVNWAPRADEQIKLEDISFK
ncbi:MAG TPA: ABC transporter substrate-binding protein [Candidatus Methylomirabilis sp.]|nr:ABC transporter substrate-binding protein [Candidatus Methylomirabilis sp.]